jgi:hypothetical protein
MLHEEIGRDDRDFAARQRLVIEHAARAAPMIGMGVVKITAVTGRRSRCLK